MRAEPTYHTSRSPDRYTDGPTTARTSMRWLGRKPTPTQQELIDVAGEHLDGPGSPFAYDLVVAIMGRRGGKSVTAFAVPLTRALAGPLHLPNGRRLPFRAIHMAQNLTQARARFNEDLVAPYRRRFRDEDAFYAAVEHKLAAADTYIALDPRRGDKDVAAARAAGIASELHVLAATEDTARGAGNAHLNLDEALAFNLEKGNAIQAGARPTMAEMGGLAQFWVTSNVKKTTGPETFLWSLRERGRAAVRADRRTGICYVEYSLPPDEDPYDERNWWRRYPALGDGIVGIEQLRADREDFTQRGDEAAFFAEYLCRWPDENPTGIAGWLAIAEPDWLAAKTTLEIPDGVPYALAVDIDPYGRSSSVVAAAAVTILDPDTATSRDVALVEVLAHGPGSGWVLRELVDDGRLTDLARQAAVLAVDDYGPGHDLIAELEKLPAAQRKLVITKSLDFVAACYGFDAGLREHTICWRASDYHEALTRAAAAAERTSGKAWQWERRVAISQTPVVGSTLAVWALGRAPTQTEAAIF
jgi:hypothetical protein